MYCKHCLNKNTLTDSYIIIVANYSVFQQN